ncbi:glycosyltransferase family 4 protein [Candidatus Pelagibacter ubique]|nr:glycosyltransferase family 4 protein [Candidatus Pelagibacter ubique]
MRIAFIAPRYHTNQISLTQFLLKKNKVFFYVTRKAKSEDHSFLKPTIIKQNFIFKIVKFFIKTSDPLFDYHYGIPSIRELLKFKSKKFDLVIIRDPINFMGFFYFLWAKFIGVKIIFYIQKKIYSKNSNELKEIIYRLFLKIFNEKSISPCLGNLKFKKVFHNLTYLPFCLSVNSYKKKWFLGNRVNIISVGKFISRKNHLLLIRVLMSLKETVNFRLTIVGECLSNKHYIHLRKVKKEAKKSGLKISILTNVNPKKVKYLYKKHDLFVLPSVDEPASVSNLEAMSYGLPVITTDTNSTSCYTINKVNGFVVMSNNFDSLRNKLKFFLINKKEIKNFGKKSLSIVEKKNNPNIIYKNYFENTLKI